MRKPFVSVRATRPQNNANECLPSFHHDHMVLSHSAHRVLHSSQQPWEVGPMSEFELLPPRKCGKAFPAPPLVGGTLCLLQESSWTAGDNPRSPPHGAILPRTAPSHNPRHPLRCLQYDGHLENTGRVDELTENLRRPGLWTRMCTHRLIEATQKP